MVATDFLLLSLSPAALLSFPRAAQSGHGHGLKRWLPPGMDWFLSFRRCCRLLCYLGCTKQRTAWKQSHYHSMNFSIIEYVEHPLWNQAMRSLNHKFEYFFLQVERNLFDVKLFKGPSSSSSYYRFHILKRECQLLLGVPWGDRASLVMSSVKPIRSTGYINFHSTSGASEEADRAAVDGQRPRIR